MANLCGTDKVASRTARHNPNRILPKNHQKCKTGCKKEIWECWLCQLYFSVETGIIHDDNINTNLEKKDQE
jgi:hypothetical protein